MGKTQHRHQNRGRKDTLVGQPQTVVCVVLRRCMPLAWWQHAQEEGMAATACGEIHLLANSRQVKRQLV